MAVPKRKLPSLDELLAPLTEEERDITRPEYIGPTWKRDEAGKFILPKVTLGREVVTWMMTNLQQSPGQSYRPTAEQVRFLMWWYAVDPESGKFIFDRGVIQRARGWGKDPLSAAVSLVEFIGPCRVEDIDPSLPFGVRGKPHPYSLVQLVAVGKDQNENTGRWINRLQTKALQNEFGIKGDKEVIRAMQGQKKIEWKTARADTQQGNPPTFASLGEISEWKPSKGHDVLFETVGENLGKADQNLAFGQSRFLANCNAPEPGARSVAERLRDEAIKVQAGTAAFAGLLYDSIEADPRAPLAGPLVQPTLRQVYGDSTWPDFDAYEQKFLASSADSDRHLRMYYNRVVANNRGLYSPEMLAEIKDAGIEPLAQDESVVLGFDGSTARDATALVAFRISDKTFWLVDVWERPSGDAGKDWVVPRLDVDTTVRNAHQLYNVKGFYADLRGWESYIDLWNADFGDTYSVKSKPHNAINWDMSGSANRYRVAQTNMALRSAIENKVVTYDGNETVTRHFLNTRRRVVSDPDDGNEPLMTFEKESPDSPNKVDIYAATVAAYACMTDLLARGKDESDYEPSDFMSYRLGSY